MRRIIICGLPGPIIFFSTLPHKWYDFQEKKLCFVDRTPLYNLVNKANLVHNSSYYVYFFSVHVSGDYVPIIRRNSCIGCIPDSHQNRITSNKCPINTVVSPDDGHIVARNI
jgi:hypothetical protein